MQRQITQKENDKRIYNFNKSRIVFLRSLYDHLSWFMPLSNEDEEKDLLKVFKILNKYQSTDSKFPKL